MIIQETSEIIKICRQKSINFFFSEIKHAKSDKY